MARQRKDLRPYQARAVEFVKKEAMCGLFMDMGLGKTAVTLTAITDLIRDGEAERVLVVGPIRVIETVWRQEAAEWAQCQGLVFSLVRGTPAQRVKALETPAHIYLINPENLVWLLDQIAEAGHNPFDTLVIDESSKFKNGTTQRFKRLRNHVKTFKRRILLTGTPSPNSLMDLWPQMFIMDNGARLDTSFGRFRNRYFHPTDKYGYEWKANSDAFDTITQKIEDITLRLQASDWLDLPEQVENVVHVTLPPAALRAYKAMEDDLAAILSGTKVTAVNSAAAFGKCHQIANGALYLPNEDPDDPRPNAGWEEVHDAKLEALAEMVDEIGEPVLIAYHFQHDLARLRKLFPDAPVMGRGSNRKPEDVIAEWNRGQHHVMLLHPGSAGHGLNLQHGGRHIIFFSLPPGSLENHDQVIARIGPARRAGKKDPTVVHYLVAEDTVDMAILGLLRSRAKGQNAFLGALREYTRQRAAA